MRAIILAAGRGQRMGELTTNTPKPLLKAGGQYLIEYPIQQLVRAGISDIVINISYHGEQIKRALGDGSRYGVHIEYSEEQTRLETGGGIVKAMRLLGEQPFIALSSDVITDYPLASLPKEPEKLAHLVLVENPSFHPDGDFGLHGKVVDLDAEHKYTFGNIAVYSPALFVGREVNHFPVNELLFPAIRKQEVTGELYQGQWFNIGTQEQLLAFDDFKRLAVE